MALFVLGAGATRGSSFVKPEEDPCLPPLDSDFFTQLQRVGNPKHRDLITEVMADIVELFGPNFETTMEHVFTTLEHSDRMLKATTRARADDARKLKAMRARLVQAISVVLEDSLTERDPERHSRHKTRECTHHAKLVKQRLRVGDDLISFNYDCVLDYALKNHGRGKWNPRYGYGFILGARGRGSPSGGTSTGLRTGEGSGRIGRSTYSSFTAPFTSA